MYENRFRKTGEINVFLQLVGKFENFFNTRATFKTELTKEEIIKKLQIVI